MIPEEPPKHYIYFGWGAFRMSLCGRGAILAWGAVLAAACAGINWHTLLRLL
jgi:hypothetical protein